MTLAYGSVPQALESAPDTPRVLIVDDDPDIRANLADILMDLGYDVDTAPDGPAALKLAARRVYDVALLDLTMPGMDGLEVYRRLKRLQAGTVAIVVTAHAAGDMARQAVDAGVWQVMAKPLDPAALLSTMEQLTQGE